MPNFSIIDGKILARKLEYNVVDHCNLRCSECSHLSPYQKSGGIPVETFQRDLERLAAVYKVERFRFVGGEPLLARQLPQFASIVRASGVSKEIEIATNGVLLNRISDDTLSAFDKVSVSLYPTKQTEAIDWNLTRKRFEDLGISLKVEQISRFRTMEVSAPLDPEEANKIFNSCLIAHTWGCQTFYDGFFYLCSRPIFLKRYLEKAGHLIGDLRIEDGVELHAPDLLNRLLEMLKRDDPLKSCTYCLGTAGEYADWRQLQRDEVVQPMSPESTRIDERRMAMTQGYLNVQKKLLRVLPSRKVAKASDILLTRMIGD